jgi:hypothetical protein
LSRNINQKGTGSDMASAKGLKQTGFYDCAGGGQVVVENGIAYIAHMRAPHGTSIVDVRDPKNPKLLASLDMPPGTHSHKVRVGNGLMVVNQELNHVDPDPIPTGWKGGLRIFDIATPGKPREITRWQVSGGVGVHRFDFDGRYVYMSPTQEGYVGNIMMIMDLKDPAKPTEVGRWWLPGQHVAGGEKPTWDKTAHRCHHPLRMGNRLYTSYWQAGFVILDIEDMAKPKFVSGLDWSPPFSCPTHTCLPLPFDILGRRYIVVADEDVQRKENETAAFTWLVDVTDERHPVPVSSFQVEGIAGRNSPPMTGCHQPCEKVMGTEIPFTWFANGLRILDFKDPHAPREVAHFLPDPPAGQARLSSNDLTVDDRGLIYVIDRVRGLTIVERT